jgi:hypothetical protein
MVRRFAVFSRHEKVTKRRTIGSILREGHKETDLELRPTERPQSQNGTRSVPATIQGSLFDLLGAFADHFVVLAVAGFHVLRETKLFEFPVVLDCSVGVDRR